MAIAVDGETVDRQPAMHGQCRGAIPGIRLHVGKGRIGPARTIDDDGNGAIPAIEQERSITVSAPVRNQGINGDIRIGIVGRDNRPAALTVDCQSRIAAVEGFREDRMVSVSSAGRNRGAVDDEVGVIATSGCALIAARSYKRSTCGSGFVNI